MRLRYPPERGDSLTQGTLVFGEPGFPLLFFSDHFSGDALLSPEPPLRKLADSPYGFAEGAMAREAMAHIDAEAKAKAGAVQEP